jgi:hypothetical protein
MPTFPATLPAPTFDGYALSPVDPVIRTEMEVGSPRARRRTKARNDKIDVTWIFTDAQMASFRTWFDSDAEAAGGAAWFTVALAVGTTGIDGVEARFAGIWKSTLTPGMNWSVSAQLEIR